jgi:hypothetical protein
MSAILAQIGTKVGTELQSLGSRVFTLESNGGGGGGGGPVLIDSYSETSYVEGRISQVTTWDTSSKVNLISTKHFTYNSGRLTQVIENDGSQNLVLTKTLTYDSGGNLESITKDYA